MKTKTATQRWGGRVPSPLDIQDQKRLEMLKAAALFFSTEGYHSTNLKDVAHSIGITKSLFYYYFKDKQQLLYECSILAHTKIQFEFPVPRSKREFLGNFFCCLVTYIEIVNGNNFQFIMFMEPDVLTKDQLLVVNRLRDRFEKTIRDVIAEGQKLGVIVPVDVKVLGFSLLGSINWMARWWRRDRGRSLRDLAGEIIYVALRGLALQPKLLDDVFADFKKTIESQQLGTTGR